VIDFGILALHHVSERPAREAPISSTRLWITAFGEVVFDEVDDGEIRQPGQWQRVLAAIAQQLDDKFGAIDPPEHTVH
jgi:hypothetical protein